MRENLKRNIVGRTALFCVLWLMLGTSAALADAVLDFEKKVTGVSGSCVSAGDSISVDARTTIRFCYTIRNVGSDAISNLQLVEDNGTPSDPSDDFSVPVGAFTTLTPAQTLTVLHDYDAEVPGSFVFSATVSGSNDGPSGGTISSTDGITGVIAPVNASITVTKRVTTSGGNCFTAGTTLSAEAGTEIQFCYTILNSGKAALLDFTLTEDNGTPGDTSDDFTYPLGSYGHELLPAQTLEIANYAVTLIPPHLGAVDYEVTLRGTNDGTSGGTITESDAVTVTWSDTIAPVITQCVEDIHVLNTWAILGAKVAWNPPSVTDSSGMMPSIVSDPPSGSLFPLGTTPVDVTVTDAGGNTDTCTFDVTVTYGTPPRIWIDVPEDKTHIRLDEHVFPSYRVETAAALSDVETSELPNGTLDTLRAGKHEFVVEATDEKGLSTRETTTYYVVYQIGPQGDPGDWSDDWLFIEQPLLPVERIDLGATTLGGQFISGTEISIFFTLRNAAGVPQSSGMGQLSITRVEDVNDAIPPEVIAFYAIGYDTERSGYAFSVPTSGWTPGIYDLWLGLNDDTSRRVRVELINP